MVIGDEKKEWIGISVNEATFMGKVIGTPSILDNGQGGECAFINLRTVIRELGINGQWYDSEIIVPLTVMDQGKVAAVKKFVMAGRQLMVKTYYKTWTDGTGKPAHGLIVTSMSFGSKPYVKENDNAPGPALPPV